MDGTLCALHDHYSTSLLSATHPHTLTAAAWSQIAAFPNFQAYLALELVICPLYCNAVLANLNSRAFIRGGDTVVDRETSGSLSGGGTGARGGRSHHVSSFRPTRPNEVRPACVCAQRRC